MSFSEPHSEFLELCAVSTSGELTEEEQKKLQAHLLVCESCRETLKQYETVVNRAIPAIAASETTDIRTNRKRTPGRKNKPRRLSSSAWKKKNNDHNSNHNGTGEISPSPHRLPPFSSESTWRHVWMLYGAGILLFVTLSFYAYRWAYIAELIAAKLLPSPTDCATQPSLEAQLSDAGHERQIARAQIEQRDKTIAEIRQQMTQYVAEIKDLRAAKDRLENDLRAGDTARQDLSPAKHRPGTKTRSRPVHFTSASAEAGFPGTAISAGLRTREGTGCQGRAISTRLLREREAALTKKMSCLPMTATSAN